MKLGAKCTPDHILSRVPYLHSHMSDAEAPLVPDQSLYTRGVHGAWGDLGNIDYGDCIYAGYGHYKQCSSSNAKGHMAAVTTEQVLGWYTAVTGFDRNDPNTDNGSFPVEALNYFMRIGEIAGYARIDLFNREHIARAMNLFCGIYVVLRMPLAWRGQSTWGVGPDLNGKWLPNSWGSHCVYFPDYNSSMMLTGISWGDPVCLIPEAIDYYVPEAYVIISNDWVQSTGRTIQGFDLDGLQSSLRYVM